MGSAVNSGGLNVYMHISNIRATIEKSYIGSTSLVHNEIWAASEILNDSIKCHYHKD
jgi:hypothetical protein